MLDVFAVHVHHMQGAIRRIHEIHRAKPIVGRSDHLSFAIHTRRLERDAIRRELESIEQVPGAFADEDVVAILRRIGAAAITGDTAGCGDDTGADEFAARHVDVPLTCPALGAHHAPRFRRGDGIHRQLIAGLRHVIDRTARRERFVAREIAGGQNNVLGGIADVAEEAVAPVIKRTAKACAA